MLRIALLLPLLVCPGQDDAEAIRKYVSGVSSVKPDLEGWTWQRVNKALAARIFSDEDNGGREQSHTVKQTNGHESTFYYYVPESYDPSKPTTLGIYLHGGVASPQPKRGRGQWRALKAQADKFGWIVCSPSGSTKSLWWATDGVEQILGAIRFLSAKYNVDRNRVFVSGFSDGASGVYFLGMAVTDNWAACVPWNGAIGVVVNPRGANTPYYLVNCRGTAWRATHGSRDTLYPAAQQKPAMDRMKAAGVKLEWKNFEGVGHEGGKIIRGDQKFINGWIPKQVRNPLPKEVDWTTHDANRFGRAYWIRIRKLGDLPGDPFADEKQHVYPVGQAGPPRPMLGVRLDRNFTGGGCKISEVVEGSGAEEAGMKSGDVIVGAGGREVGNLNDLRAALKKVKSGGRIKITIERDGKEQKLDVPYRPVKRPKQPKVDSPDYRKAGRIRATVGENKVVVKTKRISQFEILVSPKMFDLDQEIVVVVNGEEKFRGNVKPDASFMIEEMRRRHGDTSVTYVGRIVINLRKDYQD